MIAEESNDSSSAALRPEISTVTFNHCVIDGNNSESINITHTVPKDFKVQVLRYESSFQTEK